MTTQEQAALHALEQRWRERPSLDIGSDWICAYDVTRRGCADELLAVLRGFSVAEARKADHAEPLVCPKCVDLERKLAGLLG